MHVRHAIPSHALPARFCDAHSPGAPTFAFSKSVPLAHIRWVCREPLLGIWVQYTVIGTVIYVLLVRYVLRSGLSDQYDDPSETSSRAGY